VRAATGGAAFPRHFRAIWMTGAPVESKSWRQLSLKELMKAHFAVEIEMGRR
jgi:hypothetical protein